MKKFDYIIKDDVGIHARPAGFLAKTAKEFESEINIEKNGRKASLKKLMAVMSLEIKCGDKVTVSIEGDDEEKAEKEIRKFFEENLWYKG